MRKSRDAVPRCVDFTSADRQRDLLPPVRALVGVTDHKLRDATFIPAAQLGFPHFVPTEGTWEREKRCDLLEGELLMQELSVGWSTMSEVAPFSLRTFLFIRSAFLTHPFPRFKNSSQDKPQRHKDTITASSMVHTPPKCSPQPLESLEVVSTRLVGPRKTGAQQLYKSSKIQGCLTQGLASPQCG